MKTSIIILSVTVLAGCGLATASSLVNISNKSRKSITLLGRDKSVQQQSKLTANVETELSSQLGKHHSLIVYDTHTACNYINMNPGLSKKKWNIANGWYLKVVANNKTIGKVCAIKENLIDPNTHANLTINSSGSHYSFELKNSANKSMEQCDKNVTFDLKGTF